MKLKCLRRRGIDFISSCPSGISPKTGTKNQAFGYPEIGQTAFDYISHFHFYLALKVEEALEVLRSAPFPVGGLEVPQIILVLGVGVAVILGVVTGHPPELLEPAQC